MKLEKAIEINDLLIHYYDASHKPDYRDAVKLGNEALKQIKDCRSGEVLNPDFLLPGETKD